MMLVAFVLYVAVQWAMWFFCWRGIPTFPTVTDVLRPLPRIDHLHSISGYESVSKWVPEEILSIVDEQHPQQRKFFVIPEEE